MKHSKEERFSSLVQRCRLRCVRYSAGAGTQEGPPPRRIIFICNSLGFFRSYFSPTEPGQLESSRYLRAIECPEDVTVFENLYHPGMDTSNHDSEKSFLTGAPNPESTGFHNTISLDQLLAREMGECRRAFRL